MKELKITLTIEEAKHLYEFWLGKTARGTYRIPREVEEYLTQHDPDYMKDKYQDHKALSYMIELKQLQDQMEYYEKTKPGVNFSGTDELYEIIADYYDQIEANRPRLSTLPNDFMAGIPADVINNAEPR